MKVKLDKVAFTEVEVDVPDECPKCEARLTAGGDEDDKETTVRVHGYMAVSQDATLGGESGIADWGEDTEDFYEVQYHTGIRCRSCDHVLATTEE